MVREIAKIIKAEVGEKINFSVEASENSQFGHYAANVALRLSGVLKRPPIEIAKDLAKRFKAHYGDFFEKVEAAPPGFINFWLSKKALKEEFLKIVAAGSRWGKPDAPAKSGTIVIDYSHPNIAKPMSIAHLRSTIIGQALYNIFKFSGWKTIGDNHLGDWGKQFGILIAAYQAAGAKKVTLEDLFKLYVDFSARLKTEPALDRAARLETKKLQSGNPESLKLWKRFYKISLAEFQKIYRLLEVKFDYYLGESFYKKMLSGVVKEALEKAVAEKSQGAVIVTFPNLPPFIIQKSDQAYLYSTTDLAALKYRLKKFKPQLVLYVVDNGQSLHFEQLFEAAKRLGYLKDEQLVHVKFGLVLSEDLKKLSTRAGRHIALASVIDEALARARRVVDEKRPELSGAARAKIARTIGLAALKYNDLSQNRQSDIAFDWNKMLNFEGQSAPYLMYTYVRLRSIVRKAKFGQPDPRHLEGAADFDLILKLIHFPDVIARAAETYFPHLLADYLYQLSRSVNGFYETEPVLKAKNGLREARLNLVAAASGTLKAGLKLLGIKVLEEM